MRVLNSTTKNEPIDALKPHPRNPRQGDIGAIHTSIQTNGFYGTIIAQKSTGYILAGNHRWQAARQTKTKTIPVTWLDVDDDHALRILLADNRTNDLATYNDEALAKLLKSLHESTGTLLGTGYDGDDLDELIANLTPPDWTDAMDALPDGDKSPFQQMAFTLHDDQAARVKQAIDRAKATENFTGGPNENGNGNALAAIAEAYIRGG
jgi:ParB-like chromosome segregation protein Spo0J